MDEHGKGFMEEIYKLETKVSELQAENEALKDAVSKGSDEDLRKHNERLEREARDVIQQLDEFEKEKEEELNAMQDQSSGCVGGLGASRLMVDQGGGKWPQSVKGCLPEGANCLTEVGFGRTPVPPPPCDDAEPNDKIQNSNFGSTLSSLVPLGPIDPSSDVVGRRWLVADVNRLSSVVGPLSSSCIGLSAPIVNPRSRVVVVDHSSFVGRRRQPLGVGRRAS